MEPERFVDADRAAYLTGLKRRFLLTLARGGIAGAYPVGTGRSRRRWIFLMSELRPALAPKSTATPTPRNDKPPNDLVICRTVHSGERYDPIIRQSPLK
jgi:hypothetical protein